MFKAKNSNKPNKRKAIWGERIGYIIGLLVAMGIYFLMISPVWAEVLPINDKALSIPFLPFVTPSMLLATSIGAIGSYLCFGEDKKIPPSATSVGHVLLGFGAGLFFTRGSLELMGRSDSSEELIVFACFFWAAVGYFALRLVVSVANSDRMQEVLPDWLSRLLGVPK